MEQESDRIVTLAFFETEIEATMIVEELRVEGVEAQASGLLTAGFKAEAPGRVKVLVHEKDLAQAHELLEDYIKSKEEIDWSKVDIGEREDGLDDEAETDADEK